MAIKVADEPKVDPQVAELEAQKKLFEEAVAKTKGEVPPSEAETVPEEKPAKPAKKPTAPKKPSALEREVAELKTKLAELSKAKPEPEAEEADERVDLARARLTERYGKEEADELVDVFISMREGDRKEIAEMRRILEDATKAGRANLSRSNQKRLSAHFPQLKNETAWDVVHAQALASYEKDPKAFDGIEDAYDSVATALYGEPEEVEEEVEAPEEIERAASRIAASQMTVPTKAPRRDSRSKEERAKEHFEFIKKNPDDKAGQMRLARELGLRK